MLKFRECGFGDWAVQWSVMDPKAFSQELHISSRLAFTLYEVDMEQGTALV